VSHVPNTNRRTKVRTRPLRCIRRNRVYMTSADRHLPMTVAPPCGDNLDSVARVTAVDDPERASRESQCLDGCAYRVCRGSSVPPGHFADVGISASMRCDPVPPGEAHEVARSVVEVSGRERDQRRHLDGKCSRSDGRARPCLSSFERQASGLSEARDAHFDLNDHRHDTPKHHRYCGVSMKCEQLGSKQRGR
jgi:hypothetical protein